MLRFSLRLPDHPDWHADSHYSPGVADALKTAYRQLRQASWQARAFVDAFAVVHPFLGACMARQQRLRVFYVMGLASAAIGDYDSALAWLDEAVLLAHQLCDAGALVDLLYARGAALRGLNRYGEAADDYADCLALFRAEKLVDTPLGPAIELDLLAHLGGFTFYSGQYDVAERLLHEARARMLLAPQADSSPLTLATLNWIQALLYRWRNQPDLALNPAQVAADVYIEAGPPGSASRMWASLADVELDLGERLPDGTAHQQHIARARQHLHLATSLAAEAHDKIGQEFVRVRCIRLDRLARSNQSQLLRIEHVLRAAHRLHDEAVLADALTALGDELAAQGQVASAIDQYRQVIGLLDGSQVTAMGVWARRALHDLLEQHPKTE
jgi:tetratricopeptide (TPR) repeat protein